jgi:hypothetical protein
VTEKFLHLVLEHLRHIRGRVDEIAEDVKDVKRRLSDLENPASIIPEKDAGGDDSP